MKKLLPTLIIFFFLIITTIPCYANPTLKKESQTDWNILVQGDYKYKDQIVADYSLTLNKYILENKTNNTYEIISTSEINNKNDYEIISSLKHKRYNDNTLLQLQMGAIFPPLFFVVLPEALYQTTKIPYKKLKEQKYKRLAKKYTKPIIGKKLKKNNKIEFYTLQNRVQQPITYKLTLKNIKTNEEITLNPTVSNIKYDKKETIVNGISKNKYKDTENPIIYSNQNSEIIKKDAKNIYRGYETRRSVLILNNGDILLSYPKIYNDTEHLFSIYKNNKEILEKIVILTKYRAGQVMVQIDDNTILLIGGIDKNNKNYIKDTEIINLKEEKTKQGPKIEQDVVFAHTHTSKLKNGKILICSTKNDFIEIYSPTENSIERKNIKVGKVYLYEDKDYIYYADYNKLSKLNKNTLEYTTYSENKNYDKQEIISGFKISNNKILLAEIDKEKQISIYEYEEDSKEKHYWAKNIGRDFIRFFKFNKSGDVYFVTNDYVTILYKVITNEKRFKKSLIRTEVSNITPIISLDDRVLFLNHNPFTLNEKEKQ